MATLLLLLIDAAFITLRSIGLRNVLWVHSAL